MTARGLFFLSLFSSLSAIAAPAPHSGETQGDFERNIEAVVRNKNFYKTDHFELSVTGGVMPYDSLVNHYMLGGHVTWHLSDHYGWEVLDFQNAFPTVTSFTTNLAKDKGLSNLQMSELKQMASSSLVISPIYGKIRFFGAQVLYFDIFISAGLGLANTDTLKFSSTGTGKTAVESTVKSGWGPMVNLGLGFKIFANRAMGIVIDLRDYMVYSEVYGKKGLRSNFSVSAGLSFFLPTF